MKMIPRPKARNTGKQVTSPPEEKIEELSFEVHKFSHRKRAEDHRRSIYFPSFSEFGCETVSVLYCIPQLIQMFPGLYSTVTGWYGREYLYRHLVDEYWELDKKYMWLREYSRAYISKSKNIEKFHNQIIATKSVIAGDKLMGAMCTGSQCWECDKRWTDLHGSSECPFCKSDHIRRSLYGNPHYAKETAYRIPEPRPEKMVLAKELVGPAPVGVFARGRKAYGRNLPPEFYGKLLDLLKAKGYTPIWLGEEESTLPCPHPDVLDFSRMPESRDLETTMAIVKQCRFTVQFWTASSRLSGMMGTPFLLVESPEQLFDNTTFYNPGQEGYRLELTTFGPKKILVSNYQSFYENQETGLDHVAECIGQMESNDYAEFMGLVENQWTVDVMKASFKRRMRIK
jgi:hypothetical protein